MQKLVSICQKIIENSFYILLFITPFIFNPENSELFELPKMYFIYVATVVIVATWVLRSILAGKFIFRRTILDIPLSFFLLSQIVSTYYSIDLHTSVFGYYSRVNGGLLSLACYSLLYWAYVSNMGNKNRYVRQYLLFSALLISIWGILEHFGLSPSCLLLKGELNVDCWIQDVQSRVFATLGQPNWMAAFLVAVLPLSLVNSNKLKVTSIKTVNLLQLVTCYLLPVTLLLAIIFTKSRSGLLGLGAALATLLFFQLPKKLIFRATYLLAILIAGFFLWQYNLSDCFDLNPKYLASSTGTESCKIRTIVWKGAIEIWRNNPVFGTGPETFAYSYYNFRPVEHNKTSEWELLYNKAHNEYLNYAANTGSLGLLSYILLIAASIFAILQSKSENSKIKSASQKSKLVNFSIFNCNFEFCILNFAFLAGYISILVTNFFGFSISVVNLLFFLFPAMAYTETQDSAGEIRYINLNIKRVLLLLLTALVTCYLLLVTYRYYTADLLYSKAVKSSNKGLYQESAREIKNALFKRSDEPIYYNELAKNASYLAVSQYETQQTETAKDLSKLAIEAASLAETFAPYNLNFLKNTSLIFIRLSLIDPVYLKDATLPLEKAIQLAPSDPKIHYNLGVLYARLGETQKAEEMLKIAIRLKDDYKDPRLGLAELYGKDDPQKAREQLEFILKNIDPEDLEAKEALQILQN